MSKYIHYFVGKNKEIPPFSEKCLNSWKEYMSEEYEIKLWTLDDLYTIDDDIAVEIARIDNYNISKDFLEIYALYKYGGIYVDQNIKIVEPICDLLANSNSFWEWMKDIEFVLIYGMKKMQKVISHREYMNALRKKWRKANIIRFLSVYNLYLKRFLMILILLIKKLNIWIMV